MHWFFIFSSSGASVVAIDNKIEQAMVSVFIKYIFNDAFC